MAATPTLTHLTDDAMRVFAQGVMAESCCKPVESLRPEDVKMILDEAIATGSERCSGGGTVQVDQVALAIGQTVHRELKRRDLLKPLPAGKPTNAPPPPPPEATEARTGTTPPTPPSNPDQDGEGSDASGGEGEVDGAQPLPEGLQPNAVKALALRGIRNLEDVRRFIDGGSELSSIRGVGTAAVRVLEAALAEATGSSDASGGEDGEDDGETSGGEDDHADPGEETD